MWIRRLKNGLSVEHPVAGDELRAIKRYLYTRYDVLLWLFLSERGQPMTRQSVNYLIGAAARRAGLGALHPHMLRHSCGFYLANQGYDLSSTLYKMREYPGTSPLCCKMAGSTQTILQRGQRCPFSTP